MDDKTLNIGLTLGNIILHLEKIYKPLQKYLGCILTTTL